MSTLNVNTINNEAGTGAPDFPNGVSVNSNPIATAGSLSNRNKIINGNFDIWQRGTSFISFQYGADRWVNAINGSSATQSQQSFALGQTDVPNEPTYYCRTVVTSSAGAGNFAVLVQRIEDVRNFAGQTATLSFWAKADASKNIAVGFTQYFGTGGSPSSEVNDLGVTTCSLTTSWQKFTVTVSLPSISGKTLGTNNDSFLANTFYFDAGSDLNARTNSLGQQSGTFDIAQVQLEAGDVATPFEMRPIGQELALCQRYYEKTYNQGVSPGSASNFEGIHSFSKPVSTFVAVMPLRFSVPKRVSPSVTIFNPETGSAGSYRDFTSVINETSFSLLDIGEAGLKFFTGVGRQVDGAFHYTADAEF